MDNIKWNDFKKVEIRAGTIIEVEDFPEAIKPAYKLKIDFGEKLGVKQSSAQITELYSKDELINKQIIAIVNIPPKQIGTMKSYCLVTGFYKRDKKVVLAIPDKKVENGLLLV